MFRKKIVIPGSKDIEDEEIEIFTNDEITSLKNEPDNSRYKCLILMELGTGLRQGELLALKWDDMTPDYTEINVNKTIKRVKKFESDETSKKVILTQSPKSQQSNQTVSIPSSLIPVIINHALQQKKEKIKVGQSYTDDNFVFATETGSPVDPKNFYRSYKNLLIKEKFHIISFMLYDIHMQRSYLKLVSR